MTSPLTVLSVAYPLAPTGPDAVGGAEQILTCLDRALAEAGHCSLVIACEGSRAFGTLLPTPAPPSGAVLDDQAKMQAWANHRAAIEQALETYPVDVVHLHGIDFGAYLPASDVPVLATLHLPPSWYPSEIWHLGRANTHLHAVSQSQHDACPPSAQNLLPQIPNGVPVAELSRHRHARRNFALTLGRVCPEKNLHTALDAGRIADVPVLVGGEVFPYETHLAYYHDVVVPRVDGHRFRFLGPVGFARKRRLLGAARCLLLPTLAPETSSLVAREALACGTPVVAFPSGAIPEAIEEGKTGFLANSTEEMARAIHACDTLDRDYCRQVARERFDLPQMINGYFEAYERILSKGAVHA